MEDRLGALGGQALRRTRRAWGRADGWLLLTPYLGGVVLLFLLPAVVSTALIFARYDALAPPVWVGLENVNALRRENLTGTAAGNSLYFLALAVPFRLLGALLLALLLQRRQPGVGFLRAVAYLPTVIPEAAYALIWLWAFNPLYGPVNALLRGVGLPAPSWLADPGTAKLVFVFMSLFQIGEGFVVLLAALQEIPTEYYDTAEVLGAGGTQMLSRITLPLVAPWFLLIACRDIVLSFQYTFTTSYLMTGGDPYYATVFLPLLVYEEAFDRFRFGTGSALMAVVFVLSGTLVGILCVIHRHLSAEHER